MLTEEQIELRRREEEKKVKPLQGRILIREFEVQQVTTGGILVASTYKGHGKSKPKSQVIAEIIATGDGEFYEDSSRQKPDVTPGMTVFMGDNNKAGTDVFVGGHKDYCMVLEEDLIAAKMTQEELDAEEPLHGSIEDFGKFGVESVEALNGTVHVLRDTPAEKSEGGIYFPDEAMDVQYTVDSGTVVLVGPGFYSKHAQPKPMNCKQGMRIVYHKFGGTPTKLPDGTEIWCFQDNDIFGVEDKDSEFGATPIGNRIFVEKIDELIVCGIHIPETAVRKGKKEQQAKILAVGPGKLTETGERLPITVEVGDTAVFRFKGGTPVSLRKSDGKTIKIHVLAEPDIFFTIAKEVSDVEYKDVETGVKTVRAASKK